MSDAIEEEFELLQSVYRDHELSIIKSDCPIRVLMNVHPATGGIEAEQLVCITLHVDLHDMYPDVSPCVAVASSRGLADTEISRLMVEIRQYLEAEVGNPVLQQLYELIQEKLTDSNIPHGLCVICHCDFSPENGRVSRTHCYHHFHHRCLYRYWINWKEDADREERPIVPSYIKLEENKFTCPVCRVAIKRPEELVDNNDDTISDEEFIYEPDEIMKDLQAKWAKLFSLQLSKGAIIDVEASRRKMLVTEQQPDDAAAPTEEELDDNLLHQLSSDLDTNDRTKGPNDTNTTSLEFPIHPIPADPSEAVVNPAVPNSHDGCDSSRRRGESAYRGRMSYSMHRRTRGRYVYRTPESATRSTESMESSTIHGSSSPCLSRERSGSQGAISASISSVSCDNSETIDEQKISVPIHRKAAVNDSGLSEGTKDSAIKSAEQIPHNDKLTDCDGQPSISQSQTFTRQSRPSRGQGFPEGQSDKSRGRYSDRGGRGGRGFRTHDGDRERGRSSYKGVARGHDYTRLDSGRGQQHRGDSGRGRSHRGDSGRGQSHSGSGRGHIHRGDSGRGLRHRGDSGRDQSHIGGSGRGHIHRGDSGRGLRHRGDSGRDQSQIGGSGRGQSHRGDNGRVHNHSDDGGRSQNKNHHLRTNGGRGQDHRPTVGEAMLKLGVPLQ